MSPDKPLDLLVVTGCFPPAWSWGGQTRSIWNVCRGLQRAGARVHVVTTNADLDRSLDVPRRREEQGIDVTTARVLPGAAAIRYGLAPGLLPAIWRASGRARLCVFQGIWTFLLLVGPRICRLRGLPYVVMPRGTLEAISLGEKAGKKRLYMRWVEEANLRHAAAIQFASEDERRNSAAAIGDARVLVHPNALDLQAPRPRGGAALRRRLGLGDRERLVGISGRLHPRKGFEIIVPALAHCAQEVHLVAFGADESGYARRIRELAEEAGVGPRVHLLGQLEAEALEDAYAGVDLLVMPSYGESFGNTAIEALAQGTEVLCSERVPLGGWLAEHDLGRVVSELTAERWGRALADWGERDDRFDGDRASRIVRSEFDLVASGRRLLDDYRRLLAGTRTAG